MAARKKAETAAKPKRKSPAKAKAATKAKAAPKSKATAKKPAPTKSKTKTPFRRLTPEPEERSKRRKIRSERDPSTPEWDKNVTSQSQRNKGSFKMTRASLYDDSINESYLDEQFKLLDQNSLTQSTWGAGVQGPIKATTGTKGKSIMRRPRKQKAPDLTGAYISMMEAMKGPQRVIIPNTPKRSRFLRLSFEIRERIYSHLLKYPSAIFVKPDWQTVEKNTPMYHAICRVCKLLYDESTTYMFKENIIQAIFRKNTRAFYHYDEPALIASHFVSYYKHVVLDFNSECWSTNWFEKATESLKALIAAKTSLKTLTLVVAPKRVGLSETALGTEGNPVTFADFVWYDGDVMNALRELAPQVFKIVVKKGPTKRLTISVDLTYLNASSPQHPDLVNLFTWKKLLAKEKVLSRELRGLKVRFEEIYENDKKAVEEGKCTTNELVMEPVVELPPSLPIAQEAPEDSEDEEPEEEKIDSMDLDTEGSDAQLSDNEESEVEKSDVEDSDIEDADNRKPFTETPDTEEQDTEEQDTEDMDTEQTNTEEMAADGVEVMIEEDPEEVCTSIGDDSDDDRGSEISNNSEDGELEMETSESMAAGVINAYFEDKPEPTGSDIDIEEKSDTDESEDSGDSDEVPGDEEMAANGLYRFCEEDPETFSTDTEEESVEPGDVLDSENSEDEMDED